MSSRARSRSRSRRSASAARWFSRALTARSYSGPKRSRSAIVLRRRAAMAASRAMSTTTMTMTIHNQVAIGSSRDRLPGPLPDQGFSNVHDRYGGRCRTLLTEDRTRSAAASASGEGPPLDDGAEALQDQVGHGGMVAERGADPRRPARAEPAGEDARRQQRSEERRV